MKKILLFIFCAACFFGAFQLKTQALVWLKENSQDRFTYDEACFSLPLKLTLKNVEIPSGDGRQLFAEKLSIQFRFWQSIYHLQPVFHLEARADIGGFGPFDLKGSILLGSHWQADFSLEESSWKAALHGFGSYQERRLEGTWLGEVVSSFSPHPHTPWKFSANFNFQNSELHLLSSYLQYPSFFMEASGYFHSDAHFLNSRLSLQDLSVFSPLHGSMEGTLFLENGNLTVAVFAPFLEGFGIKEESVTVAANLQNGKTGFVSLSASHENTAYQISSRLIFESGSLTLPDIRTWGDGIALAGSGLFSPQIAVLNLSGNLQPFIEDASFDLHSGKECLISLRAKKLNMKGIALESVALAGSLTDDFCKIHYLQGKCETIPFSLDSEVVFRFDKKKLSWENSLFTVNETGRLQFAGEVAGKELAIHLKGENLLVEKLPAEVSLSFNVFLDGTFAKPVAKGTMTASGMMREGEKKIPLSLEVKAGLEDSLLSLRGNGIFLSPMHFSVDLPCRFSLEPWELSLDRESLLRGSIDLAADLTAIGEILDFGGMVIEGRVQSKMAISGHWDDPQFKGTVLLEKVALEDEVSGFSFSDLSAKLEAAGNTLLIQELTGTFGTEGRVRGQGSLFLSLQEKFPFLVNLQLEHTDAFSSDRVHNLLSGNLVVKGNLDTLNLSGELTASEMEVYIPEESTESVDTIEVTYLDEEGEPLLPPEENRWFDFSYDVKILIPKTLVIRDKKLFSRWQGSLFLRGGHRKDGGLFGDLKVVEGEYLLNGKRFEIKQGSVSLRGDLERKTSLYVTADLPLPKLTAHVTLKGPLHNPILTFRSTPPKSQREILSYLLFGKGMSDISPTEGEELTETLIELDQNKNTGPDMLTRIQRHIGIDQIDISRDEETESAVSLRIGKYISRGVFVWLNRGINDNTNRVAIEARLVRNFLLQAEIGDGENSDNEISLKWKIDY